MAVRADGTRAVPAATGPRVSQQLQPGYCLCQQTPGHTPCGRKAKTLSTPSPSSRSLRWLRAGKMNSSESKDLTTSVTRHQRLQRGQICSWVCRSGPYKRPLPPSGAPVQFWTLRVTPHRAEGMQASLRKSTEGKRVSSVVGKVFPRPIFSLKAKDSPYCCPG